MGHPKEKRYFRAPKREAVFDPKAPKLLRPEKKSGIFGHPKEKQYFRAPNREAVFDPRAPKRYVASLSIGTAKQKHIPRSDGEAHAKSTQAQRGTSKHYLVP